MGGDTSGVEALTPDAGFAFDAAPPILQVEPPSEVEAPGPAPEPAVSPEEVANAISLISGQSMTLSDFADASKFAYQAAKGMKTWTQGAEGMDSLRAGGEVSNAFQEVLRAAPEADRTLYRGMYLEGQDLQAITSMQPGDVIPTRFAASFTSSANHVQNFLFYDDEDELRGVILKLERGRALPVGKLAGSGNEGEWITSHDLTVQGVTKKGPGLWEIAVSTV
jgi:hypothetical protein